MLMPMSSRDIAGSSAFSTSSCSPVWKMSTGGIQVLGAVKPKTRNGSQRTIVMAVLLYLSGPGLPGLCVLPVNDFRVLDVGRVLARGRRVGRGRLCLFVELLRDR